MNKETSKRITKFLNLLREAKKNHGLNNNTTTYDLLEAYERLVNKNIHKASDGDICDLALQVLHMYITKSL